MEPTRTDTVDTHNLVEQQQLEQLPEALRAFCDAGRSVAELAHLAKNMIQMVSGSVEIMELGLERKQYDRVLRSWNIFEPNFMRLKKFVLDLIKYTKYYPLQLDECDVNQTVRKAIGSCESILKNKHVKIKLQQDKTIPPARLDQDRFEEIVANLVIHAFDNLADQIGEITLCTASLADCGQIELTVRDNGPALTPAMLQQFLEPFERTRTMVGTGFDLPLAIRYIQQHNGRLELSSDETDGNRVTVYLPIR